MYIRSNTRWFWVNRNLWISFWTAVRPGSSFRLKFWIASSFSLAHNSSNDSRSWASSGMNSNCSASNRSSIHHRHCSNTFNRDSSWVLCARKCLTTWQSMVFLTAPKIYTTERFMVWSSTLTADPTPSLPSRSRITCFICTKTESTETRNCRGLL